MAHDPLRIAPLMPERSPLEAHVLMPIHAKTFGREVVQRSLADWDAFAAENRRIWEIYYLPRPASQPWDTWQAWVRAYRELVRLGLDAHE
jgi:hypothetical protein